MSTGKIFDIMRYSIHDGPGIRTTVFLKGCPLNCWWCHNPEGKSPQEEIMFWPDRCIGCDECLQVCSSGAISSRELDSKCTLCGNCIPVCHAGARELVGRQVAVSDLMREIEKDIVFYDQSGGGVTFSGGEPLMQADFLLAMLKKCGEKEIHAAVDTTGYATAETVRKISPYTDLFLYDLKLINDEDHRKFTGVSNKPILENLLFLASINHNINVRIPIIPGINNSEENISAIGEFISSLKVVKEINILPYHKTGAEKYSRLKKVYLLPELDPPAAGEIEVIAARLKAYGLKIKVGG
ncbi:MAG: glycyl-radical enzyme activating protein [Bacillota bacterium]